MTLPLNQATDREQRLDAVLADYLKAFRHGSAPSRSQLFDTYPDLAEELSAFFADQDQFNRLAAPLRNVAASPSRWRPPGELDDYELLEEIARGGMGVVFRARQRSLNRIVALKMLIAGSLAGPAALQRFRMEAEAVANLDHPHIVPIYDVGPSDGQPFFSMKFMEGGTLARHQNRFSHNPRAAARLLATVAGAVHYAHQRGILHRDLKPTNILLDAEGRPHVTDFGLAKRVSGDSCPTPEPDRPIAAQEVFLPSSADPATPTPATVLHPEHGDDYATQTGVIVGTLSYMAPEQASGRSGAVTTAADVYALGAILYELLTGRQPLRGATPLETLQLLRDQEPERPSALRPDLDRDLETICLKCLEKDPRRRYPSAQALAEDLHCYVEGKPIHARPSGRMERLWLWCRRKPVVAGLTAALVLCLSAGLPTLVLLTGWALQSGHDAKIHLHQAEQNLEEANRQERAAQTNAAEAEQQRREAQKNFERAERLREEAETNLAEANRQKALEEKSFRQAHQAVNDFWVRSSAELAAFPGAQTLRKDLAERALAYYQQFLDQRGDDPALRREMAEAQVRVAQITSLVGSKAKALRAYEKGRDIYEELVPDDPHNLNLQRELAKAWHNVGTLQHVTGRSKEGLNSHLKAREYYEKFLRDHPDDEILQSGLANTLANLVVTYTETGKYDDAYGVLQKALQLLDHLVELHPGSPEYLSAQAGILNHLGVLYSRQAGKETERLEAHIKAHALREKLARSEPKNLQFQRNLAESFHNLGVAQIDAGKTEEGIHSYEEALRIRDQLVRENPRVTQLQCELAASFSDIGAAHGMKGEPVKALEDHQKAKEILKVLLRDNPDVPQFQSDLGKSYFNIGVRYSAMKLRRETREAYEQARDLQEKLVRSEPENLSYRGDLVATLVNLGVVLGQLDYIDQGLAVLQHGLELQCATAERAPQLASNRRHFNSLYGSIAELERAANHPAEAVAATIERRNLWPGNAKELYNSACELGRASAIVGKGRAELSAEERKDKDKYCDLIMETLRMARASGFKDAERLRKDKELDVVRSREDFQKLLKELGE
jgi:serine/threonine protein kinase